MTRAYCPGLCMHVYVITLYRTDVTSAYLTKLAEIRKRKIELGTLIIITSSLEQDRDRRPLACLAY